MQLLGQLFVSISIILQASVWVLSSVSNEIDRVFEEMTAALIRSVWFVSMYVCRYICMFIFICYVLMSICECAYERFICKFIYFFSISQSCINVRLCICLNGCLNGFWIFLKFCKYYYNGLLNLAWYSPNPCPIALADYFPQSSTSANASQKSSCCSPQRKSVPCQFIREDVCVTLQMLITGRNLQILITQMMDGT